MSCLPISSFKADRPTMHRKFLRISSIKELWAMTRRHSRHSSDLSFQSDSLHYAGGLMSSAHLIPYPEEPDGCTRLAFPSEPEFPVK